MIKLLVFVVAISCAGFAGSARPPSVHESPHPPPQVERGPHLEIPRNCIRTQEADGSVLVTCDCEDCGHPEARDGLTPLPYSCTVQNHTVICGYDREWTDPHKSHL